MWHLDALLVDGPFKGTWITLAESVARRGVVLIPERPKVTLRALDDITEYSLVVHRYYVHWTSKARSQAGLWVGEYQGLD